LIEHAGCSAGHVAACHLSDEITPSTFVDMVTERNLDNVV
jgi:hypothetical protein